MSYTQAAIRKEKIKELQRLIQELILNTASYIDYLASVDVEDENELKRLMDDVNKILYEIVDIEQTLYERN